MLAVVGVGEAGPAQDQRVGAGDRGDDLVVGPPGPSWRLTQGVIFPYENRTTHSCRIRTVPLTPSTVRTMSARSSAVGMTSVTLTTPVSVSCVVSRTKVSPT